jgi:hypothetical protein
VPIWLQWWPHCWLLLGWRKLVREGSQRKHCQSFAVRFRNVHIECSYECTDKRVNVIERVVTLTGPCVVSLEVTTPCRVQLCAVFGSWASKLSGQYCTVFGSWSSKLSGQYCTVFGSWASKLSGLYCSVWELSQQVIWSVLCSVWELSQQVIWSVLYSVWELSQQVIWSVLYSVWEQVSWLVLYSVWEQVIWSVLCSVWEISQQVLYLKLENKIPAPKCSYSYPNSALLLLCRSLLAQNV